jgi:hypothetical protein
LQHNRHSLYGRCIAVKRSTRIRVIADMLERELMAHPSPNPNPALLDRLKFLRVKLEDVDDYAFQQATILAARAALYYYGDRGQPLSNPDALFEAMTGYVNWMRLQAVVREKHPDMDEM